MTDFIGDKTTPIKSARIDKTTQKISQDRQKNTYKIS
jgi:hypothetical protein